jgi:hypothetical protein
VAKIDFRRDIFAAVPYCTGCGEEFYYLPHGLDSRLRYHWRDECGAYRIRAGEGGTKGPEIAAWAEKHKDCPDPVEETTDSGIRVIDRRRYDRTESRQHTAVSD